MLRRRHVLCNLDEQRVRARVRAGARARTRARACVTLDEAEARSERSFPDPRFGVTGSDMLFPSPRSPRPRWPPLRGLVDSEVGTDSAGHLRAAAAGVSPCGLDIDLCLHSCSASLHHSCCPPCRCCCVCTVLWMACSRMNASRAPVECSGTGDRDLARGMIAFVFSREGMLGETTGASLPHVPYIACSCQ